MIRPATMQDLGTILQIAESQAAEKYPKLRFSRERARQVLTTVISSAKHFCWVSEEDELVTGALVAISYDNAWAERQSSHIMLWVSSTAWSGIDMLKEFVHWVRDRRAIKVAGFLPDTELAPAVYRLMQLAGFKKHGGAYLIYN